MTQTSLLAKHIREVHFGGNWTWVNLQKTLEDVTLEEAVTKLYSFNTIAALSFHINYYVNAILNVLKGFPINANDKYSFDVPPLSTQQDWNTLREKIWQQGEEIVTLTEQLPDSKLPEIFVEEKYGSYHRNLLGLIEHTHYHLGQIVILKKLIRETRN